MRRALPVACGLLAVAIAASWTPADAHRTIVSPYTYYRDALPIFQQRCGACHTGSSVSGISLLQFEDARSRTWAIRQSLISGRMPPWFAEGDGIRRPEPITTRELDVLMTWASGGAPEGTPTGAASPAPPAAAAITPGVVLPMPAPFTLPSSTRDATHDVVLPPAAVRGRFIQAMDLRPGAPEIVRRAELILRTASGDQVVGGWQPGDSPAAFEANAGFHVTSGASLVLRMFYQRAEQNRIDVSDRSEAGIYFAGANARPVRAITLADSSAPSTGPHTFTQRIARRSRAVALRPMTGPQLAVAQLTLVGSDGRRTPLARVQFRNGWQRRYVFVTPVELNSGDRLETSVMAAIPDLWTTLTGEPRSTPGPLQISLELID